MAAPWGWSDGASWDRLIDWIYANCENPDSRLIVTKAFANGLETPAGLKALAEGAARQDAQGRTRGNWTPGNGPVIVVWPEERTVQRCVQMVAGLPTPSIILLEQAWSDNAQSFQGWARAVEAFNAADNITEPPAADDLHDQLKQILDQYENELALSPRSALKAYESSAIVLRQKLQAVREGGYDDDFIVSYAIALGYPHNLQRLRQHYSAAGS